MFAIYAHLNSTNPAPFEVPNPLTFTAPAAARWISGLWFTSLTLSLIASLLSILAKQWLNEFKSHMRAPASSPKMWAMRHSALKGGLEHWGMDAFISTLPLLLHAALYCFLIGLCCLLMPLDDYIAGVVIAMTSLLGLFYVVSGLAPVFWGVCPSTTPMLRYLYPPLSTAALTSFRVILITLYVIFRLLVTGLWLLVALVAVILEIVSTILCCTCIWTPGTPVMDFFRQFHFAVADLLLFDPPFSDGQATTSSSSAASFKLVSPPVRAILKYRPKTTVTPAFDLARILANDEPLREASVLAWMIRSLPAEEDIQAALCAAGWLSIEVHSDYFQRRNRASPLVHADLCRAAVDSLDTITARVDNPDDETVANSIRACLFVSEGVIELSQATKQFLSRYTSNPAHDLGSLSLATIHSGSILPRSVALKPMSMRMETIELIALSASRSRPCPRGILWAVVNAPKITLPAYPDVFVSTLESEILKDDMCRNSGWKPHEDEDLRLRLIAAVDVGLRYSNRAKMYSWERHAISTLYGAAVRRLAYDTAAKLPRDLQTRLLWVTTSGFCCHNFSTADVNAIGTLLLRGSPEWSDRIFPKALCNLLRHFERRLLPVSAEALVWIRAAFQPPSDPHQLVDIFQQHQSAKAAFFNSHLSLLRPIDTSPHRPSRSPWSQLLSTVSIPDTAEQLAEMACAYTVLLFVLHRRGYRAMAQALVRELLPCETAAAMIARGSVPRYHLVVHARLISHAWWTDMREHLMQPESEHAWVSCSQFASPGEFVAAVSTQLDCLDCAHDDIRVPWGTLPIQPDANEPETDLTARDSAIWEQPPHTVTKEEAPLHNRLAKRVMGGLSLARHASDGEAQQPEDMLERGLIRALTFRVAIVR